jgi:hypothetical protein
MAPLIQFFFLAFIDTILFDWFGNPTYDPESILIRYTK